MSMLTGIEVWTATLNDPDFATQIPEGPLRDALRPFVEDSPKVLFVYLNQTLTLRVLIDSKVTFLRYCLENDLADTIGSISGISPEVVARGLREAIQKFVKVFEDIPRLLEAHSVTEEQIMLSSKIGLNVSNQGLYGAGTLTVAQVLRTQPSVIIKNNN